MNFCHPPSGLCYKRNDLKELPRDCPRIQLCGLGCQNVGAAGVHWKRLPQRRRLYIGPAQSADWAMLEAGHERRYKHMARKHNSNQRRRKQGGDEATFI